MNISQEQWQKIFSIVVSAALAILAVFGWVINPSMVNQQPVTPPIGSQAISERINLDSFGDNKISNGGDLIFYSGNRTGETMHIAGDSGVLTLTANVIHSTTSITPTNGGILTPTAKLVTLTPAGALGVELGACTTGNETILYNSVNANVVITDTGNGILAGNQTLGQYDALMLACFASKWVQVSAVSAN